MKLIRLYCMFLLISQVAHANVTAYPDLSIVYEDYDDQEPVFVDKKFINELPTLRDWVSYAVRNNSTIPCTLTLSLTDHILPRCLLSQLIHYASCHYDENPIIFPGVDDQQLVQLANAADWMGYQYLYSKILRLINQRLSFISAHVFLKSSNLCINDLNPALQEILISFIDKKYVGPWMMGVATRSCNQRAVYSEDQSYQVTWNPGLPNQLGACHGADYCVWDTQTEKNPTWRETRMNVFLAWYNQKLYLWGKEAPYNCFDAKGGNSVTSQQYAVPRKSILQQVVYRSSEPVLLWSTNTTIIVGDLTSGPYISRPLNIGTAQPRRTMFGQLSSNGKYLTYNVLADQPTSILETGSSREYNDKNFKHCTHIGWSGNARYCFGMAPDGKVYSFDGESKKTKLIASIKLEDYFDEFVVNYEGSLLALLYDRQKLEIFDVATGHIQRMPLEGYKTAAWNRNNQLAVCGPQGLKIINIPLIWQYDEYKKTLTLEQALYMLAFARMTAVSGKKLVEEHNFKEELFAHMPLVSNALKSLWETK